MKLLKLIPLKYKIIAIGAISVLLIGGYTIKVVDIVKKRTESAQIKICDAKLDALSITMYDKCEKAKQLTREITYELEEKLSDVDNQYRALLMRTNQSVCIPIDNSRSAAERDDQTSKSQLSNGNGLQSWYLLDFAKRCEESRLRLLSLQDFVTKSRGAQ